MTTDPGEVGSEEPPPCGGQWRTLYLVVVAHLAAWMAFLALFTCVFR
jgi:hypothetical protein